MMFPQARLKHIIQYVQGKIEEKQDETLYKIYVTDNLRAISGCSVRWYDLINDSGSKREKTPEQIKAEIFDVFKKLEVINSGD